MRTWSRRTSRLQTEEQIKEEKQRMKKLEEEAAELQQLKKKLAKIEEEKHQAAASFGPTTSTARVSQSDGPTRYQIKTEGSLQLPNF